MILGLTPLGVIHTLISLVAVAAGVVAFVRDKEIVPTNSVGRTYVYATIVTCITGFGIFQHGGFGKPHVLGILTLLVLALASVAWRTRLFGALSAYVALACYSLTFFFHMIPGFTETFTRLPADSPVFSGPDDPGLQKVIGVVFVIFLVGLALQIVRLRANRRSLLPGQPA